jgi:hypothetical protein
MNEQTCRVIEDYESAYPDPLNLKTGETVSLGERDDEYPGWIMATDSNGKAGWVPETYLEIDGDVGTLVRDYDATELTVNKGDVLRIIDEESEWVQCVTGDGKIGWIPLEKVDLI